MTKATWVFVAGTYRSASTTQYLIARDIVAASGSGCGIGYYSCNKVGLFDNKTKFIVCKAFKPLWSRGCASRLFNEDRVKVLVTIRDPRDIATSMKFRQGGGDKARVPTPWFVRMATEKLPRWLDDLEMWVDMGCITRVSRFDAMINHLRGEVKGICNHIGIGLDEDMQHVIAVRYGKTAMTERRELAIQTGKRQDEWLQAIPPIIFGSSGAYKSCLSDEERTLVEESTAKFMDRFGYAK